MDTEFRTAFVKFFYKINMICHYAVSCIWYMIWIYFNLNLWFEYIEYEFVYDIYDLSLFSQLYRAAHMFIAGTDRLWQREYILTKFYILTFPIVHLHEQAKIGIWTRRFSLSFYFSVAIIPKKALDTDISPFLCQKICPTPEFQ